MNVFIYTYRSIHLGFVLSINNINNINIHGNAIPKVGYNIGISMNNASSGTNTFKRVAPNSRKNITLFANFYTPKQLLLAYSNPQYVESLIERNPKITKMLADKGLKTTIYPENIINICNSHITTTTAFALQIANNMKNISQNEKRILEQACVFHDYGKILIPPEILEKPDILTEDEKEIVDIHAQLGYELLSKTGMNKRVLNLIKNHHNPMTENTDILGQILSVADIYSALREERSYKNTMSEKKALKLLDRKAKQGEVSTEVVNALKEALKKPLKPSKISA